MNATILLCDFAETADGKLFVLGGGWNLKGFNTQMALAILIEVPWGEANRQHQWRVQLLDADGRPVASTGPQGEAVPVQAGGQFEVGRPAGIPEGTALNIPLAVNIGPLPLTEGRYTWRLELDGTSHERWQLGFTALAPPAGSVPPQVV